MAYVSLLCSCSQDIFLGLCPICRKWEVKKELHYFFFVGVFLSLGSTNIFPVRKELILSTGCCWVILCLSQIWGGSFLSFWLVYGKSISQPISNITSMMWLWERYSGVLLQTLDNMLFMSETMQPFSELNKHFTQQYYPWQYYSVLSVRGLSG